MLSRPYYVYKNVHFVNVIFVKINFELYLRGECLINIEISWMDINNDGRYILPSSILH